MTAEVRLPLSPPERCYWITSQMSPLNVIAPCHPRRRLWAKPIDKSRG
jgi:hypothetical protein